MATRRNGPMYHDFYRPRNAAKDNCDADVTITYSRTPSNNAITYAGVNRPTVVFPAFLIGACSWNRLLTAMAAKRHFCRLRRNGHCNAASKSHYL